MSQGLPGADRGGRQSMSRWILSAAVVALYLLHQDIWFWETARPLVFGFLPIGLFYHVAYSVAVAVLMVVLVRYAWPSRFERHDEVPR